MKARSALTRLAGYHPAALDGHSHDDQQPIVHVGWVILLGATVAGTNWGIGSYVFAGAGGSAPAVGAGILFGLIGFSIVVIIDRGAVYAMDTHAGLRAALWPLVAFRILLTCFVSSITTHAVAPLFLKSELQLKSLDLQEEAERSRNHELEARYDIAGLQVAATNAEAEVRDARKAAEIVPAEIQALLAAARTCWQGYAGRRAQLLRDGFGIDEARRRLAGIASGCARSEAAAHRQLQEYRDRSLVVLAAAEIKYQEALRAAKDTTAIVTAKQTYAAAIERKALTPLNSTVLDKLIATDAGARWKFWSAFGLIMGLELLPLLSKLLAPQTVAGIRVATDRVIAVAHQMRRRKAAVEEQEIEEALRSSMASAMRTAIEGPDLQRFAARVLAAKVAALVPMEVFKALMDEIEARDYDLQSFCHRHPSHARILTDEWQKTVDETIEMLRRTRPEFTGAWCSAQRAA
jgi:hypothetical protein